MLKIRDRIVALLHEADNEIIDHKAIDTIKGELYGLYIYFDLGIDIIKDLAHSIIESVSESDIHISPLQKEILKQAFFKFLEENEIEAEYFEQLFSILESRLSEKSC